MTTSPFPLVTALVALPALTVGVASTASCSKTGGSSPPTGEHSAIQDMKAPEAPGNSEPGLQFKAEAWADNWFAMYLDDKLVGEDSVSITTERSFNSETFTFRAAYPLNLNVVIKDFKQDDTGLEYIGSRRQQMGDGGFIAQITDAQTGSLVAVTNSAWRCLVIHKAPLDKSCEKDTNPSETCKFSATEEPSGWKSKAFDNSGWKPATEFSAEQVRPKDGYDQIAWNDKARLIWTSDLEMDNTLLCKLRVENGR